MTLERLLKRNGQCCITGRSLKGCKDINVVPVLREATWSHPLLVRNGKQYPAALVHPDLLDENGSLPQEHYDQIIHVIEVKKDKIIYHLVSKLDKVDE